MILRFDDASFKDALAAASFSRLSYCHICFEAYFCLFASCLFRRRTYIQNTARAAAIRWHFRDALRVALRFAIELLRRRQNVGLLLASATSRFRSQMPPLIFSPLLLRVLFYFHVL